MKTTLSYVFDEDDSEEAELMHTNANNRSLFLFELFHNFFRQWKHAEVDPPLEEVKEKLYELKDYYQVHLSNS